MSFLDKLTELEKADAKKPVPAKLPTASAPVPPELSDPVAKGFKYTAKQVHTSMHAERGSDLYEAQKRADIVTFAVKCYSQMYGGANPKPLPWDRSKVWTPDQWVNIPIVKKLWFGAPGSRGVAKAMDTISTPGQEWVFSTFSFGLDPRIWRRSFLASVFQEVEIPQGANQLSRAKRGAKIKAVVGSESTTDDPTLITQVDPNTESWTVTATKLEAKTTLSQEQVEDQALTLDNLFEEFEVAHADAAEDALINGSDAATHFDTDTQAGAANLAAKMLDGLIFESGIGVATGNSTTTNNNGGQLSRAGIRAGGKAIDADYNARSDLMCVVASATEWDLLGDIDTDVRAPEPGMVSLQNMELSGLYGMPMVISTQMRTDVANTGVNAASGNTFARALIFNPRAFVIGRKRDLQMDVEKKPGADGLFISSTQRFGFTKSVDDSAVVLSCIYNFS